MPKKFFWMTLMIFAFFQISGDERSYSFDLYTLDDVLYSTDKELKNEDAEILAVDFFSIHCEPCRKALPQWETAYRKYSEKGLKFVVVALPVEEDRSAELKKIKEFFKKGKFSFPVVFDKYSITGKKFGIVDGLGSASIPMIFMLDKSGKIVFKTEKHAEFIKKIETVLEKKQVKGSEIAKTRPAVVVSNDVCNEYSPVITIVPCSTKIDKIYATEVLIKEGMDKQSKACADQIRTVDKTRIVKILGEISSTTMKQIENAIMIHLDIR